MKFWNSLRSLDYGFNPFWYLYCWIMHTSLAVGVPGGAQWSSNSAYVPRSWRFQSRSYTSTASDSAVRPAGTLRSASPCCFKPNRPPSTNHVPVVILLSTGPIYAPNRLNPFSHSSKMGTVTKGFDARLATLSARKSRTKDGRLASLPLNPWITL